MSSFHMRLWRRKTIIPGVTVNLAKSGLSLSLGAGPAHVTFGPRGVRETIGLPGSGLYLTRITPWSGLQQAGGPRGSDTRSALPYDPSLPSSPRSVPHPDPTRPAFLVPEWVRAAGLQHSGGWTLPTLPAPLQAWADQLGEKASGHYLMPIGVRPGSGVVTASLADVPHLLIAGRQGRGKSVLLQTMLSSLIGRETPERLRVLLIDLAGLDLSPFSGVPHAMANVVKTPIEARVALEWVREEVRAREQGLSGRADRSIESYNDDPAVPDSDRLPRLVVAVDGLDPLASEWSTFVEAVDDILGAGRAVGVHLIATAIEPSAYFDLDLIRAFPGRIEFRGGSHTDSLAVLGLDAAYQADDMEYAAPQESPVVLDRLRIADADVLALANHWRAQAGGYFTADLVVRANRASAPHERAAQLADQMDMASGGANAEVEGTAWRRLEVPASVSKAAGS